MKFSKRCAKPSHAIQQNVWSQEELMNTCEGMKLPALLFKFHNEELASFGSGGVSISSPTLIFGNWIFILGL